MIKIHTNGRIDINDQHSGYAARQEAHGTVVWSTKTGLKVQMPSPRYSLAAALPLSGVPGRIQFEQDLMNLIKKEQFMIADDVKAKSKTATDAMELADKLRADADQDWEHESTTYTFEDGSKLIVSGSEFDVVK